MTDPSDLAATLRRFLANPKAKVGSVPVAVLPHDFVAEVASALERGAAAERVIALGRQLNAPLHLVPEAKQMVRDYVAALAAYTALKETDDG